MDSRPEQRPSIAGGAGEFAPTERELIMARAALDHSLVFHRLQEARQELFEARSGFPLLSPLDRARLIARCEANVASAERWFARTSMPEARPPA